MGDVVPIRAGGLVESLSAILERVESTLREREELPCAGFADDKDARNACQNAQARSGCAFKSFADTCPWEKVEARSRAAEEASKASGVPAREHGLIVSHVWDRSRLAKTEPMEVMRTILLGGKYKLRLKSGELLIPARPAITVLAGPRGIGKTLAACYWLARSGGGLYRTAYALGEANADLREWIETPRLVIDQLGREYAVSDYAPARLEGILDSRYANHRPTVICANMTRKEFAARYNGVVEARLEGDGVFADLSGEDLRKRKP